ncbi:metal-dependent hydrolase, partial [Francisella tularensis]|nr:metal-dependent hydrolase [Francisella tularensis]
MIIDSHCHLNYLKFEDITLEQVINNAKKADIDKIVSIAVAFASIPIYIFLPEYYHTN